MKSKGSQLSADEKLVALKALRAIAGEAKVPLDMNEIVLRAMKLTPSLVDHQAVRQYISSTIGSLHLQRRVKRFGSKKPYSYLLDALKLPQITRTHTAENGRGTSRLSGRGVVVEIPPNTVELIVMAHGGKYRIVRVD
jgi:hypothetical protein